MSQLSCFRQPLLSQVMCAGNGHLLRVGLFIIACRYTYVPQRGVVVEVEYKAVFCKTLAGIG